MAEDVHADNQPEHPSVRFERTDAQWTWIVTILAFGAFIGLLILVAVWGFFRDERQRLSVERRSEFPLAPGPSGALPPEPRLEQIDRLLQNDVSNVYLRQQLAERYLRSYGPTSDAGFVRVPIDAAIQYLATQKPLPARTELPSEDVGDNGLVDWGESNSGRLFNRRPPPWLAH